MVANGQKDGLWLAAVPRKKSRDDVGFLNDWMDGCSGGEHHHPPTLLWILCWVAKTYLGNMLIQAAHACPPPKSPFLNACESCSEEPFMARMWRASSKIMREPLMGFTTRRQIVGISSTEVVKQPPMENILCCYDRKWLIGYLVGGCSQYIASFFLSMAAMKRKKNVSWGPKRQFFNRVEAGFAINFFGYSPILGLTMMMIHLFLWCLKGIFLRKTSEPINHTVDGRNPSNQLRERLF